MLLGEACLMIDRRQKVWPGERKERGVAAEKIITVIVTEASLLPCCSVYLSGYWMHLRGKGDIKPKGGFSKAVLIMRFDGSVGWRRR